MPGDGEAIKESEKVLLGVGEVCDGRIQVRVKVYFCWTASEGRPC